MKSKRKLLNLFFDVETTHTQPASGEMISICMIVTDLECNELGRLYEECSLASPRIITDVYGKERNLWPDATGSNDPRIKNATDVHGIPWEKAKDFQKPIEMHRKIWKFLNGFGDVNYRMIFHSEINFDPNWLFHATFTHSLPLYKYLVNRTYTYDNRHDKGDYYQGLRYADTMSMARAYIRKGKDYFKAASKIQKKIDKFNGYLTKKRKTPAKPEKLLEWKTKRDEAKVELDNLEVVEVELTGWSLDKICKALGLTLRHHHAESDTEVLVPIYKFFSEM